MATTAEQRTAAVALVPHLFRLRVYWEDTDAAGIVYYANYLRFIERARSDLVRAAGIDQRALQADPGVTFQVRRCEIDYLAPARLDDVLEVVTTIRRVAGASIDMRQVVVREGAELARATVRVACVGGDGRPNRLPPAVRRALCAIQVVRGES